MSQLATPTIGFGTAPRTPLAVVPEAQAKRGWFEKTFSGKPVGVSLSCFPSSPLFFFHQSSTGIGIEGQINDADH
jgi:hypothetical protein